MHRQREGSSEDEDPQPSIRECRECFLAKLQRSLEDGKVGFLLGIVLGQQREDNELLFRHLQPWESSFIPLQFRAE